MFKRIMKKLQLKKNKILKILSVAIVAVEVSCVHNSTKNVSENVSVVIASDTSLTDNDKPIFDDPEGEMDSLYRVYGYVYSSELEDAVQNNDTDAKQLLASMYAYGIGGVKANRKKAFQLYRNLAEQGDAQSQAYIGYMMLYAIGPIEDAEAGIEWLEKSANQRCPTAFYYLANYFEQIGDTSNARICYQNAINLGMQQDKVDLDNLQK